MARAIELKDLGEFKVANNGVTFHLSNDGKHEGKLVVKRAGIEWRKGKQQTGKTMSWQELFKYMESK